MAKDCYNQVNTITFKTVTETVDQIERTCVKQIPRTLQFCKRTNLEIFLTAPESNSMDVEVTFKPNLAKRIFQTHPASSPLILRPGRTSRWEIKRDIDDLIPREDFGDPDDASHARVFHLTVTDRCPGAVDVNDVHIEC